MRSMPSSAVRSHRFRPRLERLDDRLARAILPAMIGPDPLDNAETALIVTEAALDTVANAPGAVAARIAPPYEFQVDPNADPGIRNDGLRTPRTRTR